MRNWMIVGSVALVLFGAGCKRIDDGHGLGTQQVRLKQPWQGDLRVATALGQWMETRQAEQDAYGKPLTIATLTDDEGDLAAAYRMFFRDFQTRELGAESGSRTIDESTVRSYTLRRGLPFLVDAFPVMHATTLVHDIDAMEEHWEAWYARTTVPDALYPQPHELRAAQLSEWDATAPLVYSATAVATLARAVEEALAHLPWEHRETVTYIMPSFMNGPWWGRYFTSGVDPRYPKERARGVIVISVDLVLLDEDAVDTATHEVGHAVDDRLLDHTSGVDLSETFYQVSWRPAGFSPWDFERLTANDQDFVTFYAETNPLEDFADHYKFYVRRAEDFRWKIRYQWATLAARTPEERMQTPLFRKYYLLSTLFHEEYGETDPEITALLEQLPTYWPMPRIDATTLALNQAAPALRANSGIDVCCSGYRCEK